MHPLPCPGMQTRFSCVPAGLENVICVSVCVGARVCVRARVCAGETMTSTGKGQ